MITREEFDRKYFTAKSQSSKNEACLEYIHSLESQLSSNPLQVKCDGCYYYDKYEHFNYCDGCTRHSDAGSFAELKDKFTKDTK